MVQKVSFKIGNAEPIEETEHKKLLGIRVLSDLKWSKDLEKLAINLSKRLFVLSKIEQIMPKYSLKMLQNCIFMGTLRYGMGIWCPIRINE